MPVSETSKSYPSISFRIDEQTKKAAGDVFGELGMDMTTGLTVYLRKVARDKRIPFDLSVADDDARYHQYVAKKLAEAENEANSPDAKWFNVNEASEIIGL